MREVGAFQTSQSKRRYWLVVGALVVAALLFTAYELIIIFLQAYIFALLTAVYIELSLHADAH